MRVSGSETVLVNDIVRDTMILAVPRLENDEQIPLIEPDETITYEDDAEYAEAFLSDSMPVHDLDDEVSGLILLDVPSLDAEEASVPESFIEVEDDGLDEQWLARTVPNDAPSDSRAAVMFSFGPEDRAEKIRLSFRGGSQTP